MARPLSSLGGKKKCSNSQKSNDSVLLVYLIVLTRQENGGLKARSDSIFEIVLLSFSPNQNFSYLKNINTFEKYQRDLHPCFDLTIESAQLPDSCPITPLVKRLLLLGGNREEMLCFSAPCWST